MTALSTDLSSAEPTPHKGWHSRGYLPHFDQPGLIQSINFRLLDSIPRPVLVAWKEELTWTTRLSPIDPRAVELRKRISDFEDQGCGNCWLREDRVAQIVEDALLHFDGKRYRLLGWTIMPNHVHSLIEMVDGHSLGEIVHSWKSFTSKQANRLLQRTGSFWMEDYFDRFIRDDRHLAAAREYIDQNPVKAGLCSTPGEWRWGSAWVGRTSSESE